MKKDEGVGLDIMSNEAPKAMAVRTGETAGRKELIAG